MIHLNEKLEPSKQDIAMVSKKELRIYSNEK